MSLARTIRLLVRDHTLFNHGAILTVTDHEAMEAANAAVIHRRHAEAMVAKGEAEWVETQQQRADRHLTEHTDMLARHASEHREMRERHEAEFKQAIGLAGIAAAVTGV